MRVAAWCAALALVALPGVGHAPPPPPAIVPEALKSPIDGYDMGGPFQIWRYWIERQKGVVIDEIMAEPAVVSGQHPYAPILSVRWSGELGHAQSADLRTYCQRQEPGYRPVEPTCHQVLRRVYVPHAAAAYRDKNPVSDWMERAFDGKLLAAHLRREGIKPDSNWWQIDAARMFATSLPSPLPVLRANAQVDIISTRECPAMGERIAALEGRKLDWTLDLPNVGKDPSTAPPWPHSGTVIYKLHALLPSRTAGSVTFEGSSDTIANLIQPILEAAAACKPPRWN